MKRHDPEKCEKTIKQLEKNLLGYTTREMDIFNIYLAFLIFHIFIGFNLYIFNIQDFQSIKA